MKLNGSPHVKNLTTCSKSVNKIFGTIFWLLVTSFTGISDLLQGCATELRYRQACGNRIVTKLQKQGCNNVAAS